jgi:hypothetical protein
MTISRAPPTVKTEEKVQGLAALAADQRITLPLPQALFMLIGGLGPMLMAIGLSAYEGGGAGVRGLLGQLLRWRVHPVWYVVALLTDPQTLTRTRRVV